MPSAVKMRRTWFSVHKWLGIIFAIVIIPLSFTGAALVWDVALDKAVNPQRFAVSGATTLPPSAYVAAAAKALTPGEQIASIRFPEDSGPVVVSASAASKGAARPGPPQRTNLYLDPPTARVLDTAKSNEGLLRVFHQLHGSLMIPGVGRQIVGWLGVAMLISSLTGIWLWWPLTGSFRSGFRWKRQSTTNANLHYLTGFWISVPLAMLSFTGIWISFPAFFANISGAKAPNGGDRARMMAARPLAETKQTIDGAFALARPLASGAPVQISFPTDKAPEWKVSFERQGSPAEVVIDDARGTAKPPKPPQPETLARTMRRWHDGSGMGPVFQTVIFLGGMIPVLLAITGIIMWLRTRKWRADIDAKLRDRKANPLPAE